MSRRTYGKLIPIKTTLFLFVKSPQSNRIIGGRGVIIITLFSLFRLTRPLIKNYPPVLSK